MEYFIINKVELEGGKLKRIPIGYVEARSSVDVLNGYCGCWAGWADENKAGLEDGSVTLADLFDDHPVCHESGTVTDWLPKGLKLITSV
tara:strand:- start:422 stop:688 length:267 start_codon:yes stop_codon:yes gene_type:complete